MKQDKGNLLFRPDAFFARVSQEKISFVWPVVIVAIGALMNFTGAVLVSPPPEDPLFQYSVTLLMQFLPALVTWLVCAAGLYVLARAFSGTGSFLLTLQNTGYGMLPFVFLNAMTFVSVLLVARNPVLLSSSVLTVLASFFFVVQLALIAWTGYLWVCGIGYAHHIATRKAVAVVVILIAVSFALFLGMTMLPVP